MRDPRACGAQDDPDDLVLRARELLDALDAGDGVLVLTDIFGATPCNVVSRLLQHGRVEGVVGRHRCRCCCACSPGATSATATVCAALVEARALAAAAEGLVHMNQDRCCDA